MRIRRSQQAWWGVRTWLCLARVPPACEATFLLHATG